MIFFRTEKETLSRQRTDNYLSSTVATYMQSISQGDYDPPVSEVDWSPQEESTFIKALLKNASGYLENLDVPKSLKISSVPFIAHLLASLTILKQTASLSPDKKLAKLKQIGVLTQVEAGMPGPCLIYIHAILMSPQHDDFSKICLIDETIINIQENMNKFGALSSIVLSEAINYWLSIENVLDDRKRAILSNDKEIYQKLQFTHSQNGQEGEEEMTFIDKCIIKIWKNLKIDLQNSHSKINEEKSGRLNH